MVAVPEMDFTEVGSDDSMSALQLNYTVEGSGRCVVALELDYRSSRKQRLGSSCRDGLLTSMEKERNSFVVALDINFREVGSNELSRLAA